MPPWQCTLGGGVSVSGESWMTIPKEPLSKTRVCNIVVWLPPEISMPVPTGAVPATPEAGVLGSLLSCTRLSWMIVHERLGAPGQAPFWGGGASSLFRLLGTMPDAL